MNNVEPCTVQILGREYRFKHPSDKLQQLTLFAQQLDARLQQQQAALPLATRDKLLIITAMNLLVEMSEQQQLISESLQQLIQQIQEAG